MTYGPIDFIVLSFEGNQFKGKILQSLTELVDNGTIRIIDLLIVVKDENGDLLAVEVQDHAPEIVEFFSALDYETNGLITVADVEAIGGELAPNSTTAMMMFENLWAIKFKEAVLEANGQLVVQGRIPPEDILMAIEEIAEIEAEEAA